MENPFELIDARLATIEEILLRLQTANRQNIETPTIRRSMDINEFCEFVKCSKQYAYRLTSSNKVPHFTRGKKLWFDRDLIEAWLLENRIATVGEAAAAATEYLTSAARRNR